MRCVRRHGRVVAWLAIIALLSNAAAFAIFSTRTAAVDHGLGPLVICTADGAMTVPDDGPQNRQADHCPACRLVTPFILAMPAMEFAIAVSGLAGARPELTPAGQPVPRFRPSANRSRAPPLSA
jgi:hypothetical protein